MAFLGNVKTSKKLTLVLVLNICLLALMGWLGFSSSKNIQHSLNQVFSKDFRGIELLLQADRDLHQSLVAERTLMLTQGDPKAYASLVKTFNENIGQAVDRVAKFDTLSASQDQHALVEKFGEDQIAWAQVARKVVQLAKSGDPTDLEAAKRLSLGDAEKLFEDMRSSIDKLTEIVVEKGQAAQEESERHFQSLTLNILILTAVSALIGGLFTLLVTRSMTKPLNRMVTFTRKVAGGDFSTKLDVHQKDEVGLLAESFSEMADNLDRNLKEVHEKGRIAEDKAREAEEALTEANEAKRKAEQAKREGMLQAAHRLEGIVEQVTTAATELSAQIDETNKGAEEQQRRTSEIAAAMEEMSASMIEVANNAGMASTNAEEARSNARTGGDIVQQVVETISRLNAESKALESGLNELGKQAESIGQVMNIINDIADQTNLLALNAAIEAARAGEAGRGFAVVADEVRKLAEKTMTATKEVGDAISAIQNGANANIQGMQETVRTVETSTSLASDAGGALQSIYSLVESTTDQVRAIAAASQEQSAASDEITRSADEVNRIAQFNTQAMEESSQATENLSRLSEELKTLIQEMQAG